jgi:hypothetical protein
LAVGQANDAQDDLDASLKLDGLPGEGKTDLVTRRYPTQPTTVAALTRF